MKLPRYVQGFVVEGRAYHYFRRAGSSRVPLPGLPWSPPFMAAYQAALDAARHPPRIDGRQQTVFHVVEELGFVVCLQRGKLAESIDEIWIDDPARVVGGRGCAILGMGHVRRLQRRASI